MAELRAERTFHCRVRGFGLEPRRSMPRVVLASCAAVVLGGMLWVGLLDQATTGPLWILPGILIAPWIWRLAELRHRVVLGRSGVTIYWEGGPRSLDRSIPYAAIHGVALRGGEVILDLGHGVMVRLRPPRLLAEDLSDTLVDRVPPVQDAVV